MTYRIGALLLLITMLSTGCRLLYNSVPANEVIDAEVIESTTDEIFIEDETPENADTNAEVETETTEAQPLAGSGGSSTGSAGGQQTVTQPNCTISQPQWPQYTVRAGDTLARIAGATGTTVNMLAQVNCLPNANTIFTGQVLRVPRLPVVVQPPAQPGQPSLPIIDQGPPTAGVCVVMPTGKEAHVYGPGDGPGPVAMLHGTARLVQVADNAYVIELPGFGYDGWVSAMETHLVGSTCPSASPQPIPDSLPVVSGPGEPPANGCSVVRNPGIHTVYIYYGASSAHAPIAILGNYVPYLAENLTGYEVILHEFGHNGFIPYGGVSKVGNTCP